jgi:hypothetical protein
LIGEKKPWSVAFMARGGHPCAAAYRITGGPRVPMAPPSSPETPPRSARRPCGGRGPAMR